MDTDSHATKGSYFARLIGIAVRPPQFMVPKKATSVTRTPARKRDWTPEKGEEQVSQRARGNALAHQAPRGYNAGHVLTP